MGSGHRSKRMRTTATAPKKDVDAEHNAFSSCIPRPPSGLCAAPWPRPPLVDRQGAAAVEVELEAEDAVGAFVDQVTMFGAASDGSTSSSSDSDDGEGEFNGSESDDPVGYDDTLFGAEPLTPSLLAAADPLTRGCTFDEAVRMLLDPADAGVPPTAHGPEPLVW